MQGFTALVIFVSNSQLLHTTPPLSVLTSLRFKSCLCMSALLSWSASTLCRFILSTVFYVRWWLHLWIESFSFSPSEEHVNSIEWCTLTAQTHSVTMAIYCLSMCPLKMYSIYFSLPTYIVHIYSMHVCMYVKWMHTAVSLILV